MMSVAPHLRSIANSDGAVILDTDGNRMVTLNSMGAWVWQHLQSGMDETEICMLLSKKTGEPAERTRKDIREFLVDLERQKLLFRDGRDL
jgi:hypothetical protein